MSSKKVNNYAFIGKTIRSKRIEKGYPQKEFAEKCGLTPHGLRAIENGTVTPRTASLRQIALALDLPPDYFIDSKPDSKLPIKRRLVVEIDLPEDADLTDAQLLQLRQAMTDAGRHILSVIKGLDKKD